MLHDQQVAFVTALRGAQAAMPAGVIVSGGIAAEARLAIYRNNVFGNLTACLRLAYPAVERLVGADCFTGLCQGFIQAHLPVCANLYEYGADFSIYFEGLESLRSAPYLADVARLEWAVNTALHAADVAPLESGALAGVEAAEAGFIAHPSVTLLILRQDAHAIWEAVLLAEDAQKEALLGAVEISDATMPVIVTRARGTLEILQVNAPAFDFALTLLSGFSLADALEAATPDDAPAMLGMFLAQGLFAGFIASHAQPITHKENQPCQT